MRYIVAAASVWILLAATTSARDIYVNNKGGDDRYSGGSDSPSAGETGPCRTIARALRAAQKGDRIILVNTGIPYHESVTLNSARHSGTARRPFEFIGNGAVLEGAAPVPKDAWKHFRDGVFYFSPERMSYQFLFRDGVPLERIPLTRSDTRLPELEPLQWCLLQRKVYLRTEENVLPPSYNLSYCALAVGISLLDVRHVIISDLIIQGFQMDGVNAHDNAFDTTIRNVTVRGNARSGISVGGASRITIQDSLIGNNGEAQLRTEGYSHTHLANCNLLDSTAPAVVQEGGKIYQDESPNPEDASTD